MEASQLASALWPDSAQSRQPQCLAAANPCWNPSGLWNFTNDNDVVSGNPCIDAGLASGSQKIITGYGVARSVSGTGTGNRYTLVDNENNGPGGALDIGANDFSIVIKFQLDSTAGYEVLSRWRIGTGVSSWAIESGSGFTSSFSPRFLIEIGSTGYTATIPGLTWVVGETYTLIGTKSGTVLAISGYAESTKAFFYGTGTCASGPVNFQSGLPPVIGELGGTPSYNSNISLIVAAAFKYALTPVQCADLSNNIWQLFNAPIASLSFIKSYLQALGGAGADVSTGAGTMTQAQAMAGTGADVANGAGTMTQAQAPAAAGADVATGSSAVTQRQALAATGADAATGSSTVTQAQAPTAAGVDVATGGGIIKQAQTLAPAIGTDVASGAGTLNQAQALDAAGTNVATGHGALTYTGGYVLPDGVRFITNVSPKYRVIMIVENIIYIGRDNALDLMLSIVNQPPVNHCSFTRVKVIFAGAIIDSLALPALFDLSHADRLILKFGAAELSVGRQPATLIIFDNDHPDGLVWGDLVLIVRQI